MATHTTDFWPEDIGQPDLRTPVGLLREQATALGEKTRNLVTAEVRSESDVDFIHALYLVAPALHYSYQLLLIRHHPVLFYPMKVKSANDAAWAEVPSEDQFVDWLKRALASESTRKVIRALIAQSQGQ